MTIYEVIYLMIHVFSGILGCFIYNKTLKYDSKSTKLIWNLLVFLNGPLGLLLSVLSWVTKKIN